MATPFLLRFMSPLKRSLPEIYYLLYNRELFLPSTVLLPMFKKPYLTSRELRLGAGLDFFGSKASAVKDSILSRLTPAGFLILGDCSGALQFKTASKLLLLAASHASIVVLIVAFAILRDPFFIRLSSAFSNILVTIEETSLVYLLSATTVRSFLTMTSIKESS